MTNASPLPSGLRALDRLHVIQDGQRLAYFGGCDYYRLSWHPAVRRALSRGVRVWGLNVAASRKTTGNHPLYEELEDALARLFAAPSAVLLSSGYVTSLAAAQALAGEFTHVLMDELAHLCLQDAARFFEAPVRRFRHRDPHHLETLLRQAGRSARPIVLTDGLFAHDGSVAPLPDYLKRLPQTGRILVDDAHGAGVLGKHGRGTPEWAGLSRTRLIQTITLSKAFGVYGGAVLGSTRVCNQVRRQSHVFTGNTPLPLPLVAASLTALEVYRQNPGWREELRERTHHIKSALRDFPCPPEDTPGPMVCWPVWNAGHRQALDKALRQAGIFPSFIQYPGGPRRGYFRFALSNSHPMPLLDRLVEVLRQDVVSKRRR